MRLSLGRLVLVVGLFAAGPAAALEAPAGPILLTVSGDVTNTNSDSALGFDKTLFESLPFTTVETETPWTEGIVTFEGVALGTLLELAGARGDTIRAVALNDYAVDIPVADGANPMVIVAYRMNGETMRVRDKGPLWLIYPLSDEPALNTQATRDKMIWQIKKLVIN